jgi:hypothetical protein
VNHEAPDAFDDEGEDEVSSDGTRRRRLPRLPKLGPKPPRKKLSEILQAVADEAKDGRISVGDLLGAMDGRAFGALILVFAFPNILPAPPGLAAILGLPLVYLSAQLMLGHAPWLPKFIANRSLTHEAFRTLVTRIIPWIERAEKMLKQRLWLLVSPPAERVVGAICLFLSLVLILPIPFGNMLPAVALSIIALGLLERDGIWILGGIFAAFVATGIVASLAYAMVKSAIFVVMGAF